VIFIPVVLHLAGGLAGTLAQVDLATYRDPNERFTCTMPGDWRVQEFTGSSSSSVAFFGPPTGINPYSAYIAVRYYGNDSEFTSQQAYVAARIGFAISSTPVRQILWKGRLSLEFTAVHKGLRMHHSTKEPENVREHTYAIPHRNGFFAVVHSAPDSHLRTTDNVFRALLDSLTIQP